MIEIDRIYNEDCLLTMQQMPDNFIDLTVTSPPYDNLRTYNGFCFDFENVAKQLYRVTKDGGVVVWVVNDATINGSETGTSFRQALFFKDCGFNLHDTMIWVKNGGGAVGSNYSYMQNFEYMFVFSKGRPKSINLICDKPNNEATIGQQYARKGRRRQNGEVRKENRPAPKPFSRRNNWWYLVSQKEEGTEFHPAVFPEQLAADHIRSWSNEGDLVYDPFLGSGTTAKMAVHLKRHYIGSEISKEYFDIAEKRIWEERRQLTLF